MKFSSGTSYPFVPSLRSVCAEDIRVTGVKDGESRAAEEFTATNFISTCYFELQVKRLTKQCLVQSSRKDSLAKDPSKAASAFSQGNTLLAP